MFLFVAGSRMSRQAGRKQRLARESVIRIFLVMRGGHSFQGRKRGCPAEAADSLTQTSRAHANPGRIKRPAPATVGAAQTQMSVLVIDNYDSFTYNLVQYLGELGAEVSVRRNDEVTAADVEF